MEIHKLLQKQIKKYLPDVDLNQSSLSEFLTAINQSYLGFERDMELMNHAFLESEKEYNQINKDLKDEYELKKQSIAKLYESLKVLQEGFEIVSMNEDENDLLFISKYLNRQLEKIKKTEKELTQTVELLRTLLANLRSGILVEDENRKILFTNQLFCDKFSIPLAPDQMIGIDCSNSAEQSKDLFLDSASFGPRIEEILSKQEIVVNELLETKSGRFLERDYIPIFIKNVYKGHLWKYTDVTSRIKTQDLLKKSEERNRLIMDSALNAIITINTQGNITYWNDRAEFIFGWKRAEVLGKKIADFIIPHRHREDHTIGMERYMVTGIEEVLNRQMELPAMHKDGYEFPVEISIIPIEQNNETFFCSFIQDISERRRSEESLRLQEEKYRHIIANMDLGLLEIDNDGKIKYANQSFLQLSGYDKNELEGKSASPFFLTQENFEVIRSKAEGRRKGISEIFQIPVRNKRGELRWWAISLVSNFDDKGIQIGLIGIYLDITDQKKLEFDLAKEKIKAEEASMAKEAFLANMSHEIRTPLNAIIGFLRELSKQELATVQRLYIENSSIAAKHLLAIINNILDISKIEAQEMVLDETDFKLQKSIKNVVSILEPKAIQKGIKLLVKCDDKIARVLKGDSLRIEEILFNLVGNSLKFTSKGSVTIKTELLNDKKKSQEIKISVIDTGIGMSQDFLEKIFKKFSQEDKSTTRKFGGTGLGMTITKQLVTLMNGDIEVKSEKDKGTTIEIILQLKKGTENLEDINVQEDQLVDFNGAKILLVEDNELNRMVAQNSLQYFNCKVTEAENGLIALDILKNENFDIILMDIQMPELDGIETTTIIRKELNLKVPIIALTANAFKTEIEKCYSVGINDYVTKPFDEVHLIETISKNLMHKNQIEANEETILYDLTSLNNLSRGNNDFVVKMIEIFVTQTSDALKKIDQLLIVDDFEEVSRIVHKIKPSVEGVGIVSIINDVKNLEAISKNTRDKESIQELFEKIKTVLLKAIDQINKNEL